MRTWIVLLACLAAPGFASAGDFAGSIEFQMGLGGTAETEPEKGPTVDADLATSFGITPAIEKMLGRNVGIGGEWGFWWVIADEAPDETERRLIMSPHMRVRMSFPIVKKVTFDGLIGIGPSIWMANKKAGDDETRIGWSLRFAFGGGYEINDGVHAFANLGYYTTTAYPDENTVNMSFLPLSLGLRGEF